MEKESPNKQIMDMTVKELREIAREIPEATGVHAMKKDELLTLIQGAEGPGASQPSAAKKPKKAKTEKAPLPPKEIKALISELREEKEAAQAARDKGRTAILRRRISRLKKQTRKALTGT